jgi:hypothetical protein
MAEFPKKKTPENPIISGEISSVICRALGIEENAAVFQ